MTRRPSLSTSIFRTASASARIATSILMSWPRFQRRTIPTHYCGSWSLTALSKIGAAEPCKASFSEAGHRRLSNRRSIGKLLAGSRRRFPINAGLRNHVGGQSGYRRQQTSFRLPRSGVNRISVGVQSFQPRLLKFLGRVHSADEARSALDIVQPSRLWQLQLRSDLRQSGADIKRVGSRPRRGVGFSTAASLGLQPDL